MLVCVFVCVCVCVCVCVYLRYVIALTCLADYNPRKLVLVELPPLEGFSVQVSTWLSEVELDITLSSWSCTGVDFRRWPKKSTKSRWCLLGSGLCDGGLWRVFLADSCSSMCCRTAAALSASRKDKCKNRGSRAAQRTGRDVGVSWHVSGNFLEISDFRPVATFRPAPNVDGDDSAADMVSIKCDMMGRSRLRVT